MDSDILRPRQSKTKTIKKMARSAIVSEHPALSTHPSPSVADIKPMAATEDAIPRKKVSLANIRNNVHPKHWYNLTKPEKLVLLGGLISIFIAIVTSSYLLVFKAPKSIPLASIPQHVTAAPKPTTVEAPLTGLQIEPALAARPVTAVMIENSPNARPQSGLQDAGIVFEAIAEGGITRFIALYQDSRPQYIGPVRSLRPYYIDFSVPFDAAIAHVGGSPEALAQIRAGGKDLDQFFNSGAYWRQPTRYAPHNVYTSFDRLDALNQSKGYTASAVKSWPRKAEKPAKVVSAKSIDINISSALYNSHYDYDPATNSYGRSQGGAGHISTTSPEDGVGQQLRPKVVIAIVMSYGIQADGKHSEYGVNGSGNVYIFQDGEVITGTWAKADRSGQFIFKDAAGVDVKLAAGQTWVTVVSDAGKVIYKP
jgi:Protein of unknown function (DUF3048) N-terminal domain/Protein of unknown function (DUF3048) C-terminal domain